MCGIFGYSGNENASKKILNGLKRLEYRGYDSWGIAVSSSKDNLQKNFINIIKKIGPIGDVDIDSKGFEKYSIGIGHTRWATHGGVTEKNAHPHLSTDSSFGLAQNGIVENYQELKSDLIQKGYKFISETDTEVIVRLIEEKLKTSNDLKIATREAFLDLKGRNTIIILDSINDRIIAVRNGSPLVVGVGENETIIASDTLSFSDLTDKIILIENNEMIECIDSKIKIYDLQNNNEVEYVIQTLENADVEVNKEGFDHFMLKEIVEQRFTIKESIQYTDNELENFIKEIRNSKKVYTIGAGTAGFAAMQIAYFLRKYARIDAIELKSYEIDSYKNLFTKDDIIIAVSQSGETADTIEAIELAKSKGTKVASIVNMLGSTITRLSDYKFFTRSGPEICVASTKAFTAQISWGLLLAFSLNTKSQELKILISELSEKLMDFFNEETFENENIPENNQIISEPISKNIGDEKQDVIEDVNEDVKQDVIEDVKQDVIEDVIDNIPNENVSDDINLVNA